VVTWILGTLSPELHEIIREPKETARQAWLAIEAQFLGNSELRVLQLDARFCAFKQGNFSIRDYCCRMRGMADDLRALGETVTSRHLVLNLLQGLNKRFDHMKIFIKRSQPFPFFHTVRNDLELEEIELDHSAAEGQASAFYSAPSRGGRPLQQQLPPRPSLQEPPCPQVAPPTPAPNPNNGGKGKDKGKGKNNGSGGSGNNNGGAPAWPSLLHWCTMGLPAVTDWVTDSGASNHTTSDAGNLTSVRPPISTNRSSIVVGNGSALPVTSVGDSALSGPFYLNNVLVTPDIIQNLLSVHHFTTDNWCSMEFDPFGLSVKDLSTQSVITRCNSSGPLYTMRLPSHPPSSPVSAPSALVASASTWHRRLGHPSVDVLSKLSHESSVVCSRRTHDICHACQLGRHIRLPFVGSNSRANNNFDLIQYDLWTSPVVSIFDYKYYLVILHDHSHFVWTFPSRVKSDTLSTLSYFFAYVSTQFGRTIKVI
jgi:hypothetical protein